MNTQSQPNENLKTYTIEGSKGTFEFTLSEPSLKALQMAMVKLHPFDKTPANPYEAGEIILRDSFRRGDPIILTDPEYIMGASLQCIEFVKFAVTSLKKN